MTLARVERWIALLPRADREQPCLEVDGRWFTPNEMLAEIRAGTELGRKAQEKWEAVGLGTEEDMLVERIKRRLERYPPDKPLFITLGVPALKTPQEIISEVEARSDIGKRWIEGERSYLRYLDKLKERV